MSRESDVATAQVYQLVHSIRGTNTTRVLVPQYVNPERARSNGLVTAADALAASAAVSARERAEPRGHATRG